MKSPRSATLLFCACLTLQAVGADKKSKSPPPTPSTLPPTSPMIAPPSADATPADGAQSGKLISSEMSGRDLEFFTKAVEAGRAQAFLITLLKAKASSDQIKSLADALATTQEEENSHIARLAALKGWNVSLEPGLAQKKDGAELDKLSGPNFDKAAMDKIVAASAQAMDAYQGAAQSTDKDIKIFAAQMLPLSEEKRHVVEKMTGAGSKAAGQLFRKGSVSDATPSTPPAATPAEKATPAGKGKGKHHATPAPTPTPAASTAPVATPPGQSATATPPPNLPAILPSKKAASSPKPVTPPPAP